MRNILHRWKTDNFRRFFTPDTFALSYATLWVLTALKFTKIDNLFILTNFPGSIKLIETMERVKCLQIIFTKHLAREKNHINLSFSSQLLNERFQCGQTGMSWCRREFYCWTVLLPIYLPPLVSSNKIRIHTFGEKITPTLENEIVCILYTFLFFSTTMGVQ